MTYKLVALEDLRYRIANSYPPNGFAVKSGTHITITTEGLRLFTCKAKNGRKGRYQLERLDGAQGLAEARL